jgi:hypothetical protein
MRLMNRVKGRFAPYLSEAQIERDAAALLAEFGQARGATIAPPIPVEDIVEKHLSLASSSTIPIDSSTFRVQRTGVPTYWEPCTSTTAR